MVHSSDGCLYCLDPKKVETPLPLDNDPECITLCIQVMDTVRLGHIQDWFASWLPDSVCSAGVGRSSVDAWYTTALDIEERLVREGRGGVLRITTSTSLLRKW